MKERPILFSGEMVRALLDGRKNQTRRLVKPQPAHVGHAYHYKNGKYPITERQFREYMANNRCPYGQPGDRLWVREAHSIRVKPEHDVQNGLGLAWYRESEIGRAWEGDLRWRPSIHMPRWASRITLEVVSVRVERLQDISAEDARAEGCLPPDLPPEVKGVAGDYVADERTSFAILWNRINGPGVWAANPWVWVVEFKRITP